MTRLRRLLFALLCASIVLAPALAEARAGGSARPGGGMGYSSQGSPGSRSFAPANPGTSPYSASPGFAQRNPFLTGLAGGFFGSWLGSMLFPHWGMGDGYGVGGSLFSWLIIIGLVWMLFRLFRGRAGPLTSPLSGGSYFDQSPLTPAARMGYGAPTGGALAVTQTDYAAFEAILKAVQGAWDKADLGTLRHYVTPEMLAYFSETLAHNNSQGVDNHVEQVELVKGDVREAWDEGRLQYATCLMHWRAIDYTTRTDRKPGESGWLVEGDQQHPTDAQEVWTFARSPGGHWLLSAIEQV
jgi:predicted lipid-binding transport protein (Tim44 family)